MVATFGGPSDGKMLLTKTSGRSSEQRNDDFRIDVNGAKK